MCWITIDQCLNTIFNTKEYINTNTNINLDVVINNEQGTRHNIKRVLLNVLNDRGDGQLGFLKVGWYDNSY